MSESTIITLPDNHARKQGLEAKLDEYRGRLNLDESLAEKMDTICKIAVLETLLREGKVVTWDLSQDLFAKYGEAFDIKQFNVACEVIIDYCDTGGQNVWGGTGLTCC